MVNNRSRNIEEENLNRGDDEMFVDKNEDCRRITLGGHFFEHF